MIQKLKKKVTAKDTIIASLEKRLKTYRKNKQIGLEYFKSTMAIQDRKIADVLLQIKALKKNV